MSQPLRNRHVIHTQTIGEGMSKLYLFLTEDGRLYIEMDGAAHSWEVRADKLQPFFEAWQSIKLTDNQETRQLPLPEVEIEHG